MYLRKSAIKDVPAVHALLMACSRKELLLPRSYNELYSHLRDFFVLASEDNNKIFGCCALAITWENLAEVRSLVVDESLRHQGWGKNMVEACLSEALTLGLYRVFTLTYQKDFFLNLGFYEVNKNSLPQKVWADCLRCPKFPECDEIAMLIEL